MGAVPLPMFTMTVDVDGNGRNPARPARTAAWNTTPPEAMRATAG